MNLLRQATRRAQPIFILEPIEPRRHLSLTSWVSDTLSILTDAYFGEVRFGNDGDPLGYATGMSGVGEIPVTWSYTTWDTNLTDGLDSGWKTVTFALNNKNNGDMSFKVGLSNILTLNVGPSVAVNSVTLRAAVQGASMEMDWHNITVKFYSGTSMVESDPIPDFAASTMTSGTTQESVTVLTPTAQNCTGVTVAAQVRLQAAQGTTVGPNDIFGQILIN